MAKRISGYGRKRPQLNIALSNLHLDNLNPRLPENSQGKTEEIILQTLFREFDIRELIDSMEKNGYFDEEPLIAVPKDIPKKFINVDLSKKELWKEFEDYIKQKDIEFTVIEGNRRLAAAKLLIDKSLGQKLKIREFPEISNEVKSDLEILPVIIYPNRESIIPYLGIRHITGIKKWEPYAKARYIDNMKESGYSLEEIEQKIGDRKGSTRKAYLALKLVEIMEEESEGSTSKAKNNFSYILLALGQGGVKDYLGLPSRIKDLDLDHLILKNKITNLKNLFSFLFGEGKEKDSVIRESREITGKLSPVLRSPEALKHLIITRNLDDAYDLSDGEESLILKKLRTANRNLEQSLGIVHRHKIEPVKEEINKCKETLNQINKILKES